MDVNFPKTEKKILKFWKDLNIFEKSVQTRKNGPSFIFYEGPPTANARPGIHHVLSRVFKDIVCRYKTMQGFKVLRKAGWDTHGLPVELEIEKKLGLKNKKDIERYGIAKFNALCRKSVWHYKKDWEKLTERIGYWLSMNDPYITYGTNYIESIWWILKRIFDKGLIYKDYKVVPYCARCGTSLSSHEVAQGYKKVKDTAIFIKFTIKGNARWENTSILAWTTTPWTLPGNVALAVNPEMDYVRVKDYANEGKWLILGLENFKKLLAQGIFSEKHKERFLDKESLWQGDAETFKGSELKDIQYEPLYSFVKPDKPAYRVILADFVSAEDGSGVVHIAPGFGEDDMIAGKKNDLPVLLPVDEEGKFRKEVLYWAGIFVKDADPLIIEDLKKRNILYVQETYEHDYPFCWRCHSPLLYYAKESWFINMQKVKKDLIANNQKINWVPSHLKDGRFGEWLKEVKDWALSRERYWATPLPIWQCKSCSKRTVIGSVADLVDQNFSNNNYFVMRHGHSLRQIKKIAICWPEKIKAPLTKLGIEQARQTAKELKNKKIDLIFCSDLERTRQTAEIVAKEIGAKVILDKNFREYNVGIFNYKKPQLAWDYLRSKKDLLNTRLPKGESMADLARRVDDGIKRIDRKYNGKNVLIVSHELPITILAGMMKGWTLEKTLKERRWKFKSNIGTGCWRNLRFAFLPRTKSMEIDLHRPVIDEVKFRCSRCGEIMQRVPEVIDVWFDSGSMPFAQAHWPFESKVDGPPKSFPADYISEAIDQTRGWFYTLLAISTLLGFGNPFKNVISSGHVLDEKGEKMSKSKGNVVVPETIIEKYGVDSLRWYFYTINQPGEAKLFAEKDVDQSLKKFILTYWNSFSFFELYNQDKSVPKAISENVLDRWIVSKLNNLILEVTQKLDNYDITSAARAIEMFVVEDLSQWYIRRSRKRLQKPDNIKEAREASSTLKHILFNLCKLTAPFIPFLSEEIFLRILNSKSVNNSVHLQLWPKAENKKINKELEEKMTEARRIVNLALAERAKAGIKVRQPLSKLSIKSKKLEGEIQLLELIKEEVNVKETAFNGKMDKETELDIEITQELKQEGLIREIVRNIQDMRKAARLKPKDKISVIYSTEAGSSNIFETNKDQIIKEASLKDLLAKKDFKGKADQEKEFSVDGQKIWMAIKKYVDR